MALTISEAKSILCNCKRGGGGESEAQAPGGGGGGGGGSEHSTPGLREQYHAIANHFTVAGGRIARFRVVMSVTHKLDLDVLVVVHGVVNSPPRPVVVVHPQLRPPALIHLPILVVLRHGGTEGRRGGHHREEKSRGAGELSRAAERRAKRRRHRASMVRKGFEENKWLGCSGCAPRRPHIHMDIPAIEKHSRPVVAQVVRPLDPLHVLLQGAPAQQVLRRRGVEPEGFLFQYGPIVPTKRPARVLPRGQLDVFPLLEAHDAVLSTSVEAVSQSCERQSG